MTGDREIEAALARWKPTKINNICICAGESVCVYHELTGLIEQLRPSPDVSGEVLGVLTRERIIAEIMKLVRPEPTILEKPTIAELEAILNSETTGAVNINPDGSVGRRPTTTTVGAVADAILALASAPPAQGK